MHLPKQFYYKQNRLQQLRGFYYVVQNGSNISKAASIMGLTQSAVTLQIQSLERDLNIALFERCGKKMIITDAGKMLYECAVPYVHGVDDMFSSFLNINDQKKNITITLAANHAVISYILPKYIKKFKDHNEGSKFVICNLSKDEAIKRLVNGEVDFFIYPMSLNDIPPELEFVPIVKYQPILLTKKDHPLANKKDLTLFDVSKYELVRIDSEFITLPMFEEIIKLHNIKTNIEFEISDWEILKKFVNANIGVAIISNIVLEGESDGSLIGKTLSDYFPEMVYGALFKKRKFLSGFSKDFFIMITTEKLLESQN